MRLVASVRSGILARADNRLRFLDAAATATAFQKGARENYRFKQKRRRAVALTSLSIPLRPVFECTAKTVKMFQVHFHAPMKMDLEPLSLEPEQKGVEWTTDFPGS